MNPIRQAIGNIFQYPMQDLSFVAYFEYVNTSGKVTARSLMEVCTALLSFAEEQEKKNVQYEANFREIESILEKLVKSKPTDPVKKAAAPTAKLICDVCGADFGTKTILEKHKETHETSATVV